MALIDMQSLHSRSEDSNQNRWYSIKDADNKIVDGHKQWVSFKQNGNNKDNDRKKSVESLNLWVM